MSRIRARWPALACALLLGCSEADETETSGLEKYVVASVPKDLKNKLELNYDNKVQLLGYELSPTSGHKPGSEVKLKMYWRLTQDLPDGWSLFTHVLDASGERLLNIDNVGPLRRWKGGGQALPPGSWEVGKVYVDEQTFKIPSATKSDSLQIVAGVWKAEQRLKVVSGSHDKENRGIVATIKLADKRRKPRKPKSRKTLSKRLKEIPKLTVYKLKEGEQISVDGVLNDPAWRTAAVTRPFVDVKTGKPNRKSPVGGRVRIVYDDEAMYLGFDVTDKDVVGGFKKGEKDPHLWTSDTVEIMIDPDGDGDNEDYYEIQINPQNLVFDSRFDSYNKPRGDKKKGPFGHEDWSAKLTSAVTVNGTLDNEKDRDRGYIVEAKIPWKSFDKAKRTPPKPGDTWRMNFYAMQKYAAVAWSPILGKGSLHKAPRFGRVEWSERKAPPDLSQFLNRETGALDGTKALERRFTDRPGLGGSRAPRPPGPRAPHPPGPRAPHPSPAAQKAEQD